MLYIVNYSLNNATRNYQDFIATLNNLGDDRLQIFDRAWLVYQREGNATLLANNLRQQLDPIDRLFVVEITQRDRNGWMNRNVWDWANAHNN